MNSDFPFFVYSRQDIMISIWIYIIWRHANGFKKNRDNPVSLDV